jgi:hypothetical protein
MVAPLVAAAAIGAGGSILGGLFGAKGAKDAAKAQERSAAAATQLQRDQFNQSRADFAPFREGGYNALAALQYELGLGPRPTASAGNPAEAARLQGMSIREVPGTAGGGVGALGPGGALYPGMPGYDQGNPLSNINGVAPQLPGQGTAGRFEVDGRQFGTREEAQAYLDRMRGGAQPSGFDYRGFEATPGYAFQMQEGTNAVQNAMAARGLRNSGGAMKELTRFGSGLAAQEYGNFLNRLAGQSGQAQTATGAVAGLGANMAGNAGAGMMAGGQARASGYVGQANAFGNTLNQLGTLAGTYFGQQAPTGATPYAAPRPFSPGTQY